MPECVNLFDNKIEDHGEIASEETNEEYKEEREDGANQKRVLFGPTFLSRQ